MKVHEFIGYPRAVSKFDVVELKSRWRCRAFMRKNQEICDTLPFQSNSKAYPLTHGIATTGNNWVHIIWPELQSQTPYNTYWRLTVSIQELPSLILRKKENLLNYRPFNSRWHRWQLEPGWLMSKHWHSVFIKLHCDWTHENLFLILHHWIHCRHLSPGQK